MSGYFHSKQVVFEITKIENDKITIKVYDQHMGYSVVLGEGERITIEQRTLVQINKSEEESQLTKKESA